MDGKIKILRLITRLNVGGPTQHVVWLTEKLDPDRFETLLVAGVLEGDEENMDYFAVEKGVKFLLVPELKRRIGIHDFFAVRRIYKILCKYEPDIVHTHTSKAGLVGDLAWIFYNIKRFFSRKIPVTLIHTFHGYFSPGWGRVLLKIKRFLAILSYGRRMIVVLSVRQKEVLLGDIGISAKNGGYPRSVPDIRVIPLGIDLKPFSLINRLRGQFRKEFAISPQTVIVGWVGRFAPVKNPALFLEAAGMCKKTCSRAVCFVIVGGGELKSNLQKAAQTSGIADAVLFVGSRCDMRSFWADVDILASSANNEGTPVSMLEAMVCGVPVVGTDVGGVAEMISQDWEQTPQGWRTFIAQHPRGMVVGGGVRGLAEALKKLVDNTADRKSLGRAGPSYVKEVHPLKRLISDMEGLYRQVAGSPGPLVSPGPREGGAL